MGIVADIHAGPFLVSLATLAGSVIGSFLLGVLLATAIFCVAITRNTRGRASDQYDKFVHSPNKGTTTNNMTSSDAYDLVEMPTQPHNYEYVTPKP